MNPLTALSDDLLERSFGRDVLDRARGYLAGEVEEPRVAALHPGAVTASARVQGTRAAPYGVQMHVDLGAASPWVFTVCTCPVRSMCKHGAAVALTVRDGAPGAREEPLGAPDWQRRLADLTASLQTEAAQAEQTRTPLALEIGLDARGFRRPTYGRASDDRPVLQMRPLRRGARDAWIRRGAGWSEVAGLHPGASGLVGAQVEAVQGLHQAWQSGRGYGHGQGAPPLGDFGPRLVRLLREAVAAGVSLVPGAPLRAVELVEDDAVDVVLDAVRDPAGVRLRACLLDERAHAWWGDQVRLLGQVPHSVALLDDDGLLRLARLPRPVPRALAALLLAEEPVVVPGEGVEELHHDLAPLVRLLPVRSSDGSVAVPEPLLPRLELTVVWRDATDAALEWRWHYRGDDVDRRFPVEGAGGPLDPLRDPRAERALAATLPTGVLARRRVRGGEALGLAVHDLPHLRGLDRVDVVEEAPPEFREATAAPEIRFDVVAPDQIAGIEGPENAEGAEPGTDWLDLQVTIEVAGERVPLPDVLAALTREEELLVLPSGQWLRTDHPTFARLREVVAAAAELRQPDGDRLGVGTHDLGVWAQLAELGVVDQQAGEWVRRARALRDLEHLPRPEPSGIATTLRSYQRDGFAWLAFLWQHGLGGILADDMGLGKTLQVLALVAHARADRPFLVVAPTSVVTAWAGEAARHAPGLRVRTMSRRADDVAAAAADADVVVTTYALLRLEQERYAAVPWAGLVLDEAQQVKNHRSKTYAAVRRLEAPFRLAVTGTPFENRLLELWSLLSLTAPGLYPWPQAFTTHVVRPVERDGDQRALQRFQRRIRPFVLRRTKEVVAADLPPKQEQVLDVALGPRHRRIYDAHLAKARQRILGLVDDFERNRVEIFAALTELRQLALDPALVDAEHEHVGSAKIDVLVEHLVEITAEGHQALVFSQFTRFLGRVRSRLAEAGVSLTYLDGATTDRAAVIERFRSGEAAAFLISLKAGGVGLTLTEADYVFVLDPWWNPAAEAQAVDRAHRIGQQRPVHVYRLVAGETIEEKVMELKARKAALFARVIDGEGGLGGGLTADDVRALFGD